MNEYLFSPITKLPGIGEANSKYLQRLIGGNRIIDLLFHFPTSNEPIKILPAIHQIENGELVIISGKIEAHFPPGNSRQPFKINCYNKTGYFSLIFFKIFPGQLEKLKIGSEIAVLGYFEKALGASQITHPQQIFELQQVRTCSKSRFNEPEIQDSRESLRKPIKTTVPQGSTENAAEMAVEGRDNIQFLRDFAPYRMIYPLCAGITNRFLTYKIQQALAVLVKIPNQNFEWQETELISKYSWPSFSQALLLIHKPADFNDLKRQNSFRRLACDELLAWQIAMRIIKNKNQFTESASHNKIFDESDKNLVASFLKNLPFTPTTEQQKAILEINQEIASTSKMLRLLQGDVGSGKTLVAIAACLKATEFGRQAVVIVPTTVLAKQHFSYFKKFLVDFDLKLALLTSETTKTQRKSLFANLASGQTNILIATHAVLEPDVLFKSLGLAVIDEQHRFGVMQRLRLVEKGKMVDVLLMSATPIPRSLMMALYGDMQVSILAQKPQNRLPIKTTIMAQKRFEELFFAFEKIIKKGEKIFWICPAIEEQELAEELPSEENFLSKKPKNKESKENNIELMPVLKRFEQLKAVFGESAVGLLHGKMKEKQKDEVMQKFAQTSLENDLELKILVATTVIEVGIDVPSATVIVVDNAENFGLAQLHQLRGRVGRSDKESFCILLYGQKYSANARKRLDILRQSNDGFFIAEEDLKMRGSGELAGTKQSGFPEFHFADLSRDSDLLTYSNQKAQKTVGNQENSRQAGFVLEENYRYLLRIFGYEDCLKITSGG